MSISSWKLRLDPTSKTDVEAWLDDEGPSGYELRSNHDAVTVELYDIDTAFRFRLQFDEDLLA